MPTLQTSIACAPLLQELVKAGKIDQQYAQAVAKQLPGAVQTARFLLSQKKVNEEDLAKAGAAILGLQFIHLKGKNIPQEVLTIIPENVAQQFHAVAYEYADKVLKIAVSRPYNLSVNFSGALQEIERTKGVSVQVAVTTIDDAVWAISGYRNPPPVQTAQPGSPAPTQPVPIASPPPSEPNTVTTDQAKEDKPPNDKPENKMINAREEEKIKAFLNQAVSAGALPENKAEQLLAENTLEEVIDKITQQKEISRQNVAILLSKTYDLPLVKIKDVIIPREILDLLPEAYARKYFSIAFEKKAGQVRIATSRPYLLRSSSEGPLHSVGAQKQVDFDLAIADEEDITNALNLYQNTTSVGEKIDLASIIIPQTALLKFPLEIAQKYLMVVFGEITPNHLKVAAVNPNDPKTKEIIDFIEKRNDIKIDIYETSKESIDLAINKYPEMAKNEAGIAGGQSQEKQAVDLDSLPPGKSPDMGGVTNEGVPIIGAQEVAQVQAASLTSVANTKVGDSEKMEEKNLDTFLGKFVESVPELIAAITSGFIPKALAAILSYGIYLKASDIHLEPLRNAFRLRFRVDGELNEYVYLPVTMQPPIISRIKILSNLKIDEQRVPQDGRYNAIAGGHEFDVRVSSLPTVYGEKVVMRLLDKSATIYTLDKLGIIGSADKKLEEALAKPWGIIMSTGPTGSGKSTTLYAILRQIAKPNVNVITLEDPVEYEMKGINQVQVKPKIGFTFAEGLRSILRQDPNIIMVGEIRDNETAELATHAALTGHLVLTTLHTNDAAGALPRLINMKVEPFLITSAINAVIAQRLLRKLCESCRQPVKIPDQIVEKVKKIMSASQEFDQTKELKFYGPKGCDKCKNGYKGRIGIYEVLTMSDTVEELAIANKPASEINDQAIKEGMLSMQQDGIIKATQGLTSLDEVFKATSSE